MPSAVLEIKRQVGADVHAAVFLVPDHSIAELGPLLGVLLEAEEVFSLQFVHGYVRFQFVVQEQ